MGDGKNNSSKMNNSVKTSKASPNNSNSSTKGKKTPKKMPDEQKRQLREERESIVLWNKPFTTIDYGLREFIITAKDWGSSLLAHKLTLFCIVSAVLSWYLLRRFEGPHMEKLQETEKYLMWLLWWVGLGVLSSVGLGTGLHTFLLYLGPHIAAVTLAAYECGTTDFPSPPYPDQIVCPDDAEVTTAMSIFTIMSKVRVEAFCWGVGTALGELPPYFMARAHRLSGHDPDDDDEDEDEFLELQEMKNANPKNLSALDRAKLSVEKLVERVGFFGILACASIPNPLFDLAGITCGHFLVPFWTFFGATVIGKAVIKMHIQKIFIVLAFNEKLIESAVEHLHFIPGIGAKLEGPFKEALKMQKEKLHRKVGAPAEQDTNILGWIFEKLVIAMVVYFLVSILNSLAQSYHKRLHKKDHLKEQ